MSKPLVSKRKRQRYATGTRVYFFDEVPVIGSGWRTVEVIKSGRKWTRIEEISTGRTARLSTEVWCRLLAPRMPVRGRA